MAAAATDYFTEVGSPGTATTLAAPGHSIAGTSFTVVSTSNWPTNTGVIFAVDNYTLQTVNGVPNTAVRTAGTYTEWEGVVASATSITGAVLRYGTDQNYSAGSLTRVYIPVASSRENRLVQGLTLNLLNQDGTLKANVITAASQITDGIIGDAEMSTEVKPVTLMNENTFDHVASGLVWSGLGYGSTLTAALTAGVVYINGQRLAIGAVATRTFTASKDTYIDILNTAGVGSIVYTEVANNAASPALAANSVRIGIIVSGANIAAATSVNQGQEDRVLPIASSIAYSVTDSLGNLICPRDPNRKVLGYRQIITDFSTASATAVQITGLTCPVIVPTGRKVKITVNSNEILSSGGAAFMTVSIWDGVVASGTQLNQDIILAPTATGQGEPAHALALTTPSATSKTYNAGLLTSGNTAQFKASSGAPGSILVELV